MISNDLHETEMTDLYERIAQRTGEDIETIASFGFELYVPVYHEEQKEKVRSRRRFLMRKKDRTRRSGEVAVAE